jgi:hypothetical protein
VSNASRVWNIVGWEDFRGSLGLVFFKICQDLKIGTFLDVFVEILNKLVLLLQAIIINF